QRHQINHGGPAQQHSPNRYQDRAKMFAKLGDVNRRADEQENQRIRNESQVFPEVGNYDLGRWRHAFAAQATAKQSGDDNCQYAAGMKVLGQQIRTEGQARGHGRFNQIVVYLRQKASNNPAQYPADYDPASRDFYKVDTSIDRVEYPGQGCNQRDVEYN